MTREELLKDLIDNHGFKSKKGGSWHVLEHDFFGCKSYVSIAQDCRVAIFFDPSAGFRHTWRLEDSRELDDFILHLESMGIYPGVKV